MNDKEIYSNSKPEHGDLSLELNEKRVEKLNELIDKKEELSPRDIEARQEKAKQDALEKAQSIEARQEKKSEKQLHSSRRSAINKKELRKSYKGTLRQIQHEMPAHSRLFSKVIHNQFIEKTSDILGSTIARPNSMLYGSLFAFLLTLLVYLLAKNMGYVLSGSETILAFLIGWLFGVIVDYLKVLFTGKR